MSARGEVIRRGWPVTVALAVLAACAPDPDLPGVGERPAASACAGRPAPQGPYAPHRPFASMPSRVITATVDGQPRYGLASPDGGVSVAPIYDDLLYIDGDDAFGVQCRPDGSDGTFHGFLRADGREVVPPVFHEAWRGGDGLFVVGWRGGRHGQHTREGYVGPDGLIAIPMIYRDAGTFEGGQAVVWTQDDETAIIDPSGAFVVPPGRFAHFEARSEGLRAARAPDAEGGLYGYIDDAGAWVIPPAYGFTLPFEEGFAVVTRPTGDGFGTDVTRGNGVIDRTGHVVVPLDYAHVALIGHRGAWTDTLAALSAERAFIVEAEAPYGHVGATRLLRTDGQPLTRWYAPQEGFVETLRAEAEAGGGWAPVPGAAPLPSKPIDF